MQMSVAAPGAGGQEEPAPSEATVLVLDAARHPDADADADAGCHGIGDSLEPRFRCLRASSVEEALVLAADEGPDLVVVGPLNSDRAAERMVRELHDETSLQQIPLLVVLDDDDPGRRLRLLEMGVSDCIGAPVRPEEIRLRGERLMSCRREHKDEHKELKVANHQLRRTVSNLQEFTSVASHDLLAPLRGISNLAAWLDEDLSEAELPEASRSHLTLLRDRVERMQRLLNGLLDYARANHLAEPEPIDTTELLESVVDLAQVPPGFRILCEGERPTITAARVPLTQVLFNLISNAVKHHPSDQGRLRLSMRDAGDAWAFEVGDDGPGIPEEFRGRMYDLFVTQRSWDDSHGNGMGLAIVRRTVEEAGGEIGMEDNEWGGASFWFTWPKSGSSRKRQ